MNKAPIVKIAAPIPQWAHDALASDSNLALVEPEQGESEIEVDGRVMPVTIDVRRRVDAGVARLVADRAGASPTRLIVIADSITTGAREYLERAGIGYLDAQGDMHIRLPGILIHVSGSERAKAGTETRPVRLAGKAGLVAQALLLGGTQRWWQVGELAGATLDVHDPDGRPVSVGLVHRVLQRLYDSGVVIGMDSGPLKRRRLIRADVLLDLLAEEDHETRVRRHQLYVRVGPSGSLALSGSRRLERFGIAHAVTGVAAASSAAPMVTEVLTTEIRVAAATDVDEAVRRLEARPVTQGANLVLIQAGTDTELALRRKEGDIWVAAPTRVYLDALRDPRRGAEQAAEYRRKVLGL